MRFTDALGDLVGIEDPHDTHWQGDTYVTHSLIERDDAKENDARAAD